MHSRYISLSCTTASITLHQCSGCPTSMPQIGLTKASDHKRSLLWLLLYPVSPLLRPRKWLLWGRGPTGILPQRAFPVSVKPLQSGWGPTGHLSQRRTRLSFVPIPEYWPIWIQISLRMHHVDSSRISKSLRCHNDTTLCIWFPGGFAEPVTAAFPIVFAPRFSLCWYAFTSCQEYHSGISTRLSATITVPRCRDGKFLQL